MGGSRVSGQIYNDVWCLSVPNLGCKRGLGRDGQPSMPTWTLVICNKWTRRSMTNMYSTRKFDILDPNKIPIEYLFQYTILYIGNLIKDVKYAILYHIYSIIIFVHQISTCFDKSYC